MKKIAVASLAFLCSLASAADDKTGETWVSFGGVSHHFSQKNFNEMNWGLGLEYKLDRERAVIVGQYRNSIFRPTNYAGFAYTPIEYGNFRFGAIVGVADGYPDVNKGKMFPMVTPVATYEEGNVGVNLLIIPSIASATNTAFAVQFKVRFR